MPRSRSSSSSSSSSSHSSSQDVAPIGAAESANIQTRRPAIPERGAAKPYAPPRGFAPAGLAKTKEMKDGRQIWAIRLPDGVNPASLDGMVLHVPSKSSSNQALSKVSFDAQSFELHTLPGAPRRKAAPPSGTTQAQDAAGGAPGVGTGADAPTQLIAMAASAGARDEKPDQGAARGPREMEGLAVLLPDASKKGALRLTSHTIAQHLHLVRTAPTMSEKTKLQSGPAPELPPLTVPLVAPLTAGASKRKREQPEGKLGGFFSPAGANAKPAGEEKPGALNSTESAPSGTSPSKKLKKEKKSRKSEKA